MGLRAFHLFFIAIATILAAFVAAWAAQQYQATHALSYAIAAAGALAAGPQGGTQPTQGFPAPQTIGTLPLPNQIAPQTWANLAPSQQQLLIGAYEAQGWHPQDVLSLFSQSLPRYATNAPMAGTFRLQG